VINLAMGVSSTRGGNGIAWFAHIGGLAFGWVYLRVSAFGGLDNFRRWVSPVPDEPEDVFRAVPRVRPRNRDRGESRSEGIDEVVAKSNAIAAKPVRSALVPRTAPDSGRESEKLDLVLDKISKHGIESLTSEELRLLEDMSRKLRNDETR
jgi:hypothetical protein